MENNRIRKSLILIYEWLAKLDPIKDSHLAAILQTKIKELKTRI